MRMLPLLFALFSLSLAHADDGELKAEIQEVLMQRHSNDTEAWWRALGPEAPGVIITMYGETTNSLHKIHLLQGLSAFPDDAQAAAFLKGESKSSTSVIRGAALGALGASQGEKALDTLAEGLKNDDAQTRFAAAKAIRRIGTPSAMDVLNNYLKSEKVDWISKQVLADEKTQPALKPVDRGGQGMEPGIEDYMGSWKGFWISPNGAPQKPELISMAATAKLRVFGKDRELDGEITLSGKTFALRPAKLKNGHWNGMVQQTMPTRAIPAPNPGEMQLSRYKMGWTLVLRIPGTGETAVFMKN
jgi:hypothetical protein